MLMLEYLTMDLWSPYVAGAGIGVLSILAFLISDRPIGCSAAYARTSGMIEKLFVGDLVFEKAYYRKFEPRIEWEVMLVIGVVIGSFLSAILSGEFRLEVVPPLWNERFGPDPVLRVAAAFAGGVLMGLGARWAGGVHQRPRNQRDAPARRQLVACCGILLRRRDRRGDDPLQGDLLRR
jgi:hypothetical protein